MKLRLFVLLVGILAISSGCEEDGVDIDCEADCFPNGVAAGDVDQSSVMLWARASFSGRVRFEYGTDPDFIDIDGRRDQEVVVDGAEIIPSKARITGLSAGTQYYYRACPGRCASDATDGNEARGSFRTPHADGDHGLRFGVSSCWRGDMKPFVSMKNVPDRDLDFFVALGDTVYADSDGARNLRQFRAVHENAYSQSSSPDDNMFALARASTAFFVDVDDHEVVNNYAGGAPANSQVDACECKGNVLINDREVGGCPWNICFCNPDNDPDGNCDRDYINETQLFKDAMQAWYEYNPIRRLEYGKTGDPRTAGKPKLYRYRTFGTDAAMLMLDARTFRDEEMLAATDDPRRTMLGQAQLDDLKRDLLDAEERGVTWKFILVPEPVQHLGLASAGDRFEGYAYERSLILDFIERECIANVVFVSGDIHGTVANNLDYEQFPGYLRRFSSAWDISAGPAAYAKPIGAKVRPFSEPSPGSHEHWDRLFKVELDAQLATLGRPLTGLGPEATRLLHLQPWNRNVPATLLQGSYVAVHTFGWTEFRIAPATQKLIVTTYGIDWYDKDDDPPNQEPFIVSQFEVSPRPGCQPITCTNDADCGDDYICNLLGGDQGELLPTCVLKGTLENGELCTRDDACQSNRCVIGVCGGCQPAGDVCGEIDDCCDGNADLVCSSLICLGSGSLEALTPCTTDDACRSGRCVDNTCLQLCGDGFCDGVERCGGNDVTGQQCRSDCGRCPNSSPCGDDNMCRSGLCNAGVCTFPQENGSRCVRDAGCRSGLCSGGTCMAPKENGSICIRDAGCESGLCDLEICTVPYSRPALSPCASGEACRSEICSRGTCEQICGDGFCDGTEKCGGNDVTALQCRTDCGRCENGSACGDDGMCQSGLCNAGTCTAPQENGSACVRDVGCQSGLCNAGICTSPLSNGSVCVRDAGCQSELCDLGVCTAPRSKGWLIPCANDRACESGTCTAGTCTRP